MQNRKGFTLIELSIVLVIIGLLVGGVLVGRDLISAAAVRAQISQIEKYQQAVNTFHGKYSYLPGDIPNPDATRFGFLARGTRIGQGDGDGQITGSFDAIGGVGGGGGVVFYGEPALFWRDLSKTNLIDGSYITAQLGGYNSLSITSLTAILAYIPQAKIGRGNNVYVWSGGYKEWNGNELSFCDINNNPCLGDNLNYFGLSAVSAPVNSSGFPNSSPSLTVREAYNIDKKIDDGFPQSGNVTAIYDTWGMVWAAGGGASGAQDLNQNWDNGPTTSATQVTPLTCYDNNNVAGATQQYSLTQNNGTGVNCALSFKFQ